MKLRLSNYSKYFITILRGLFLIKAFLGVVFNPKYKDDTLRFTNPSFFLVSPTLTRTARHWRTTWSPSTYSWAERVYMTFNSDKFECVRYWPGTSVPDLQYLSPDQRPIEQKSHLRDLGVEMSSDVNFNVHIGNVVTSVSRLVGWSMRTFRRR